jgi:ABC-type spermidine/putrescine transport system permease subunit II
VISLALPGILPAALAFLASFDELLISLFRQGEPRRCPCDRNSQYLQWSR